MGKLLDDSELDFFSGVADELNQLAGDEINFYSFNVANYTVDPLYGEPVARQYGGPYRVYAWLQFPNRSPQAGENGFSIEFDAMCVISRAAFDEQHAPYPFEADEIEAWRTPYHDANSLGEGLFFDVIKVENDGHINDTASFVQFKLYLKRRTNFGGERRITPP